VVIEPLGIAEHLSEGANGNYLRAQQSKNDAKNHGVQSKVIRTLAHAVRAAARHQEQPSNTNAAPAIKTNQFGAYSNMNANGASRLESYANEAAAALSGQSNRISAILAFKCAAFYHKLGANSIPVLRKSMRS